ncbi:hypothetical protein HJFPF1_08063 [Paramyrothecium foliicola]|nr:hypothetical protein HJFPF1_08063 [Paramyrothecium foliicola]
MRLPTVSSLLVVQLLAGNVQPSAQAVIQSRSELQQHTYPQRIIAGVPVVDTPIVRAAHDLARRHSNDGLYRHVMRSWLFGASLIANNATLRETVDIEVHAVSALLHDLGLDQSPGSPFISADKRFEVDGAIAAVDFIKSHKHGKKWSKGKVQLTWDAIALHTQQSIYDYKEPEVKVTGRGILADFAGPTLGVSKEVYDAVIAAFPNDDLIPGVKDGLTWLCSTKPHTTYETALQPFGEALVANYSAVGHRFFDMIVG